MLCELIIIIIIIIIIIKNIKVYLLMRVFRLIK
jgi:hypothetical protein